MGPVWGGCWWEQMKCLHVMHATPVDAFIPHACTTCAMGAGGRLQVQGNLWTRQANAGQTAP